MSDRQILEPYWASNLKNQIVCKFRYVDGQEVIASVSQTTEGNPDWDEIFQKFTVEEIDANTAAGAKLHEDKLIILDVKHFLWPKVMHLKLIW
jgi:hypothetical protein